ncbi:MAG: hypothetical protein H6718_26675 [Polyangiaceae bacterium]|nr:hypothetical protein [Polyangiaceae bacterium]
MSEPEKTEAEATQESKQAKPETAETQEKRTSLDLKGAAIPVVVTLLIAVFIVYPYVKDIREHGPQSISKAREQSGQQTGEQVVVTQEATDLLAGLKAGDDLKGFKVIAVRGPRLRRIEIELGKDNYTLRVFVSRIDGVKLVPPRKTQMYAVYYENAKPNGDVLSSEEYLALVEEIAKRVEQQERKVSMPDNL